MLVSLVTKRSRKARLASAVQVTVDFSSRNQHTPKSGELPKDLAANESANRFFANAQLGGAVFHVEGLTFGCCCSVHLEATRYD